MTLVGRENKPAKMSLLVICSKEHILCYSIRHLANIERRLLNGTCRQVDEGVASLQICNQAVFVCQIKITALTVQTVNVTAKEHLVS